MYSDFLLEYNASSMGDGRAPAAAWTWPAADSLGVLRSTDVVVQFDETVDPGSVNAATISIAGVPATVRYDSRTWTAVLRPDALLQPNTRYTVRVNGVRDGQNNAANWNFSFTTGTPLDTTPPTVVGSFPQKSRLGRIKDHIRHDQAGAKCFGIDRHPRRFVTEADRSGIDEHVAVGWNLVGSFPFHKPRRHLQAGAQEGSRVLPPRRRAVHDGEVRRAAQG